MLARFLKTPKCIYKSYISIYATLYITYEKQKKTTAYVQYAYHIDTTVTENKYTGQTFIRLIN